MAALGSIELPYGLSSHHRHARLTGQSLTLPYGLSPRWHTPSLQHWSQAGTTTTSQIPADQTSTSAHSTTSKRCQAPQISSALDMGAATSVHAQPERDKGTKAGFRKKRLADNPLDHERTKPKARKLGKPLTRLEPRGASTNSPIAIDSDDELGPRKSDEDVQLSTQKSTKVSGERKTVLTTTSRNQLGRPLPSNSVHKAADNVVNVPIRSAHPVKSNNGETQPTSAVPKVADKNTSEQRPTYNSLDYDDPDDVEMVLLDIPDFDLRSKVAQLMAISPASSVGDLYRLLVMKKGKFNAAKKQIMPKGQVQPTTPSVGQERPINQQIMDTSSAKQLPTQPTRSMNPKTKTPQTPAPGFTEDSDDDVMIKIDWDDPELIYDNEIPDLPLPIIKSKKKPTKARPRSKKEIPPRKEPETKKQLETKKALPPKGKPLQEKPSVNQLVSNKDSTSPKPPSPNRRSSRAPSPQVILYKPPVITRTPQHANTSAKRTTQTTSLSNTRETSSDREFLVPDEHIFIDSDCSYIDSDALESDEGIDDEDEIEESEIKGLVRLRKEYGPGSVGDEYEDEDENSDESDGYSNGKHDVGHQSAPTRSDPAPRDLDRVIAEMKRRARTR